MDISQILTTVPTMDQLKLGLSNALQFNSSGTMGVEETEGKSFEDTLLEAMDQVNTDQMTSSELNAQAIVDPDSVDSHQLTIAMAEANMSLSIARTVLNRIVTAWKDVINTR